MHKTCFCLFVAAILGREKKGKIKASVLLCMKAESKEILLITENHGQKFSAHFAVSQLLHSFCMEVLCASG